MQVWRYPPAVERDMLSNGANQLKDGSAARPERCIASSTLSHTPWGNTCIGSVSLRVHGAGVGAFVFRKVATGFNSTRIAGDSASMAVARTLLPVGALQRMEKLPPCHSTLRSLTVIHAV